MTLDNQVAVIYKAPPAPHEWRYRAHLPSGEPTWILAEEMRNIRHLPSVGDRPIVRCGLDGGQSWRWDDWAVVEVDYYPSPSKGKPAIAICHCEYSPIEGKPKWHQVIGPFPCYEGD